MGWTWKNKQPLRKTPVEIQGHLRNIQVLEERAVQKALLVTTDLALQIYKYEQNILGWAPAC